MPDGVCESVCRAERHPYQCVCEKFQRQRTIKLMFQCPFSHNLICYCQVLEVAIYNLVEVNEKYMISSLSSPGPNAIRQWTTAGYKAAGALSPVQTI